MVIVKTLRLLALIVAAGAANAATAPVTHSNPPFLWDMSARGWSQISVAEPGRLAFLSGQVAGGPDGEHIPPDLASQAHLIVANLKKALTELGASPNDVVMVRLYVVNATTERFQQALMPLRETFSGGKPSITALSVQALYTPEYQLEVEIVVRVP